MSNSKGITLMEIIVATALIAIIAGVGIVVFNPAGQLAVARNSERILHLQAIMNAIRQNIADQRGQSFACASGPIPTSTKRMVSSNGYDIAPCLVPTYIINLPFDPATSSAHYASLADYDTGYTIARNASTSEITLSAPAAELKKTISVTR